MFVHFYIQLKILPLRVMDRHGPIKCLILCIVNCKSHPDVYAVGIRKMGGIMAFICIKETCPNITVMTFNMFACFRLGAVLIHS